MDSQVTRAIEVFDGMGDSLRYVQGIVRVQNIRSPLDSHLTFTGQNRDRLAALVIVIG
jgi:hypothetical protein